MPRVPRQLDACNISPTWLSLSPFFQPPSRVILVCLSQFLSLVSWPGLLPNSNCLPSPLFESCFPQVFPSLSSPRFPPRPSLITFRSPSAMTNELRGGKEEKNISVPASLYHIAKYSLDTASFAYIQATYNSTSPVIVSKQSPSPHSSLARHILSYKNVLSSLVQEPKAQGLWL